MIKLRAGKLVMFGLSEMNLQKLREGKPIGIDMSELGPTNETAKVLIFYGKTEADMERDFKEYIGPETKVKRGIQ
jgi:hypothetical protein